VARLDAMLQQPEHHEALMRDVVAPLAAETARRRAQEAARTDASRVSFDTLASELAP
jgi:alpha-D-ribose 1-methylphosphonate 5-triphosphate synthase subunit PhnG